MHSFSFIKVLVLWVEDVFRRSLVGPSSKWGVALRALFLFVCAAAAAKRKNSLARWMGNEEWCNLFYLSEAPVINLSLEGKYYIEGSPVTIDCEASGKPLPDVAWIRNGVLESSGKKAASLKFDNINRTDAGQYTCEANNSVEVTSSDTTIVVYCKYILPWFFFLNFIYSVTPVIGASYTKLMNMFRIPPQILFRFICMHWSQVLVWTTEFRWNHCSHYFAQNDVTICLRSHCFSWTVFNSENGLKPTPFE